jgi:2-oxoglutarate ferredoxin oxidoreductase subunit delta
MTKEEKKFRVVVREQGCKECNLCIEFCKQNVLRSSKNLNKMGYHYAEVVNEDACVGCMICTQICPDVVIEVYGEGE